MQYFLFAAFSTIVTSLPANEVSSVILGPQTSDLNTLGLRHRHGHLRGKTNLPTMQSAPVITDEMLSPSSKEGLPFNPVADDGMSGWSDEKKTELLRLLDEQERMKKAGNEHSRERRAGESTEDAGVISTQPGLVDLPPDNPYGDRMGGPYHYTNGKLSKENYFDCDNENGIRPTTDQMEELRDTINKDGRLGKSWIDGSERTVVKKGANNEDEWVIHGEKYNKCCCCCKSWTVQARKPKWRYDATCKFDNTREECSGNGDNRKCKTKHFTDYDRVTVTPYVENGPNCCGCLGSRLRGV